MKITSTHYQKLQAMILAQVERLGELEPYFVAYQHKGGDWQKRFRWDLLFAVPYAERGAWFDQVYQYADDTHVDTALRKITKDYV